jgi:mannose-6-phosphate isomerase-like protein (cupin superfamily)
VIIQQGSGKFQLNDSIYMVSSGDMITIPKNTWHGVVTTSKVPMKVISIQSPEFLGKDRVFKN